MALNTTKIIIADLEAKFKQIRKEHVHKVFYRRIADYGKYLLENEQAREILIQFREDRKRDISSYNVAFQEFISKWQESAKDLLAIAKKAGFADDYTTPFRTTMTSIENTLKAGAHTSSTLSHDDYWTQYLFLAKRFLTEGKINLLIPKHYNEKTKFFKLHTYYNHTTHEWEQFKQIREIEPWWAYNQIERLTFAAYRLNEELRIMIGYSECDSIYISDFKELLMGRPSDIVKRERLANWTEVLHDYIISRLSSQRLAKKVKYENNTLFLTLIDGTQSTIDFESQRGNNSMLCLFNVLYENWKRDSSKPLTKNQIRVALLDEGLDIGLFNQEAWLSTTVSNIRKKIQGKQLQDFVKIEYKRKARGYCLIIVTS